MAFLFFSLSFLAIIIAILGLLYSFIRKKNKRKWKNTLYIGLIIFFISCLNIPDNNNPNKTTTSSNPTIETTTTKENATSSDISSNIKETSNTESISSNNQFTSSEEVTTQTQVPSSTPPVQQEAVEPAPQVTRTYVGNASTSKFHKSSCSYVDKIKSANYVNFASRDEAVNSGYVPCKKCNP